MKRLPRIVALLGITSLLLGGCSSVSMKEPLAVTTAEELRESLEGTWNSGDGETLTVAFDERGRGQLAYVERKDDQFRIGRGELAAIAIENRNFFSVRIEEDGELPGTYLFAEYVITDSDDMVIWPPDVDRFQQAVKAGELEGSGASAHGGTVNIVLGSSVLAVLKFLEAHPEASSTRQPIVIRKLDE